MTGADPLALFERMYTAGEIPWDRGAPHPLIAEWLGGMDGGGDRALVVGCGLGWDAELLAEKGFEVTAFDVSPTGIQLARERHPSSRVDYRVANLLGPPVEWRGAFDLVVESLTVQSMPPELHARAIARIPEFAAPGGTLLVVATQWTPSNDGSDGPPFPLTRAEVDAFAAGGGLEPVRVEDVREPGVAPRWRAEFRRAA